MESKTKYVYEVNDEELVYLISENNDDAKVYLYRKYSGIIHSELKKVKKRAYALGIDMNDLRQEALLGFSSAINSYDGEEEAKFNTYATLCIKRKISNYIEKHATIKNHIMTKSFSLDKMIEDFGEQFVNILVDKDSEPLKKIMLDESLKETSSKYEDVLSGEEKTVMALAIDGSTSKEIAKTLNISTKKVYNILYRARNKLK